MHSVPAALKLLLLAGITQAFPPIYTRDVPVDTRTLAEIYEAAQKEDGFLNIAWGGDAKSQGGPVSEAWAAAFPAIQLNLTVDVSKYHDSRVNRNFQQDLPNPDLVALQTIQDFDDWKAEGHLLPYKPPTWNDFWPQFKDDEGYHMAFTCLSFGQFVWDNTNVAPEDVPTSFADVLLPKWKGKIVMTYPNDDDAVTDTFRLIIQSYGWGWWDAFIAQDIQWVRGTQTPAEVILSSNGSRTLSFATFPIASTLSFAPPAKDEFLIWPQTIAILANTTRPETAKLWMAWLTSDSVQTGAVYTGLSARSDIGTSVFSIPNADPTDFHRFMTNRKVVEQWRLQYETSIGTPQGPSPLTFA